MTMLGYPASDYAFGYDPSSTTMPRQHQPARAHPLSRQHAPACGRCRGDGELARNPRPHARHLGAQCDLRIPGNIRLPRHGETKTLLRRAFAADIGPDLARQGKRGFVLPLARWMRGPLRELCANAVDRLKQSGLCDPAGVELVWNAYLAAPETQNWSRAWMLCVLGDWIKRPDAPSLEAEHVA